LPLLARICEDVVKSVRIPVSIKVRTGWSDERITLFETLRIAEGTGVGLLVVHGRTRSQAYRGFANWDLIGEVKSRATIPVVGNGDVVTWQGAVDRLRRYGVDGVLVGRGAMHNPWIFGQVADFWEGKEPVSPTPRMQREAFATYLELLREEMEHEGRILGKLKQFAARSMKAMRGVKEVRTSMLRAESVREYMDLAEGFFERLERGEEEAEWAPEELDDLNGKTVRPLDCDTPCAEALAE
jgi:tRNA-dihydrouridine synthase